MLTRAFATLALLAAPVFADGSTLTADVQPNDMGGVDVTLSLTDSLPMAATFLAVGETEGETSFEIGLLGTLTLGLDQPFAVLPLGSTDMDGALELEASTPTLLGVDLFAQAVGVGLVFEPPPPSLEACASNLVELSL